MTSRVRGFCCLAAILSSLFVPAMAVEKSICELTFSDCPGDHDGETMQVPLNVISLHAQVKHCNPQIETVQRIETPPAVMFVIDHSGSMEEPDAGNDLNDARFDVVGQLLNEIYEINPQTEVGVVSFANRLSFDWRDLELFTRMNGVRSVDHDSYLALHPLNDPTFNIDFVKQILEIDKTQPIGAEPYYSRRLVWGTERPMTRTPKSSSWPATSIRYGTDITLGFQAALEAFGNTDTPRERRFIIFFSDGQAAAVDKEREVFRSLYYDSAFTQNVPTTFTIWFGDNPDPTLVEMTRLIKQSDYSASNAMSDLWSIQTPHAELLELLSSIVMEQIFPVKSNPSTAVVKNVEAAYMTDSSFNFTKPLPLNVASDTLDMQFKYSIIDTAELLPDTTDTTIRSNIYVNRLENAQIPTWADTVCYTRILELHNGAMEVNEITPDMNDLQVYFKTLAQGEAFDTAYLSTGTVTVSSVRSGDAFIKGMIPNGDHYLRPFQHEISSQTNPNDLTIQHLVVDSIRIVWRNTYHPLDTISLVVPLLHRSVDRPYTNKPDSKKFDPVALDSIVDTLFVGSVNGVTLNTDTAGATIWYTLDGSMPEQGNDAHRYTPGQTFDISETTLLTAFATKEEFANSKLLRLRFVRSYDRVPVQAAYYEDLDGNGIIDAFTLMVDPAHAGRLSIENIAAHPELITIGDVRSGAFTITRITAGPNPGEVLVEVTPSKNTYVSNAEIDVVIREDDGLTQDGYLAEGSLKAVDRIPPVIIEAVYVVQQQTEVWDGTADTLRIRFSEPFTFDSTKIDPAGHVRPFSLLWTDNASEYQLTLEPVGYEANNQWYRFIVRNRGEGPHFPRGNDSIWVADGVVRDTAAPPNTQDGTNRKVRLLVDFPPLNMVALAYPNPSGSGPELSQALQMLTDLGIDVSGARTVLQVSPAPATDSAHTARHVLSVNTSIYDPVGNLVTANLPSYRRQGRFFIPWSGQNAAGRMVGPGAYLAVIKINLTENRLQVRRVNIGLR